MRNANHYVFVILWVVAFLRSESEHCKLLPTEFFSIVPVKITQHQHIIHTESKHCIYRINTKPQQLSAIDIRR